MSGDLTDESAYIEDRAIERMEAAQDAATRRVAEAVAVWRAAELAGVEFGSAAWHELLAPVRDAADRLAAVAP